MDLADLRADPKRLPALLTHQRVTDTPVTGGSICAARRITLDDGASVFVKYVNDPTLPPERPAPDGFFATEGAGLAWLREAGGAPVPEVIAALPELLILEWVEPGRPTAAAAERFGRELAATHRAGADSFGAPWRGFIGSLGQDNSPGTAWPEWFARCRLAPYLRLAADSGALRGPDVAEVERVIARIDSYGQEKEAPARLHGDLWPGNVLWSDAAAEAGADGGSGAPAGGGAYLIDPAAHGGHRETDLAQLALFGGAPYLDRILAAYDETWPLPAGWRARVPLHQLHLLLVHAVLFGGAYRDSVAGAARAALRA